MCNSLINSFINGNTQTIHQDLNCECRGRDGRNGRFQTAGLGADEGQKATMAALNKRTPTYCEVCFWKCAGWVYKNDQGAIQKITGNAEDMNCNGRFCPRGTGGVGMYYDEDRLKTPLIRTEERGKQSFREATWDEAFDYIFRKD